MLSKKQLKCVKLMVESDFTQREIASQIKVSEQTICKWKKDVEFKKEFENYVKESIDYSSKKAFKTMMKALEAKSETVRYMAAKDILDRAGFKADDKLEINGNITDKISIKIDGEDYGD